VRPYDIRPPSGPSPTHYVLIDGENVPEGDAEIFAEKSARFILLYGAKQGKMKLEIVERLVEHADSVKLVRLASSGKNALDFALAFYLGQTVTTDPKAHFVLVSKDGGYDPLIKHLTSRGFKVQRHSEYDSLPFKKRLPAKTNESAVSNARDVLASTVKRLQTNVKNRPKKRKALLGTLTNYLGKTPVMKPEKLLELLVQGGHLSIDDKEAITYRFPGPC